MPKEEEGRVIEAQPRSTGGDVTGGAESVADSVVVSLLKHALHDALEPRRFHAYSCDTSYNGECICNDSMV